MALGHWAVEYLGEGNGQGGSGGFSPDITNPQDGDTLVYNATAGKWVNGSGGDGSLVVHLTGEVGAESLDKTWQEVFDALSAGSRVLVLDEYENGVVQTDIVEAYYQSDYIVKVGDSIYMATSADGYPALGGR